MTDTLIEELCSSLGQWRPRQILLSGGEPVLHPQFSEVVRRFRVVAPKVCIVTNGLLLGTCERETLDRISEFYVSFDAPDAESYRRIRGVDGFARLLNSMKVLGTLAEPPVVIARCTLQRENVRRIPELIAAAKQFGFDAISFLAVDVSSDAFSRDAHGPPNVADMQPTRDDLVFMERDIQCIETADGFVEGGKDKLNRLLQYFRALLGDGGFPRAQCNAPWVSAVIETSGRMRGCFFQPVIGDFRTMNGAEAVRFRRQLNVSMDSTCRRCVCSKLLGSQEFIRM